MNTPPLVSLAARVALTCFLLAAVQTTTGAPVSISVESRIATTNRAKFGEFSCTNRCVNQYFRLRTDTVSWEASDYFDNGYAHGTVWSGQSEEVYKWYSAGSNGWLSVSGNSSWVYTDYETGSGSFNRTGTYALTNLGVRHWWVATDYANQPDEPAAIGCPYDCDPWTGTETHSCPYGENSVTKTTLQTRSSTNGVDFEAHNRTLTTVWSDPYTTAELIASSGNYGGWEFTGNDSFAAKTEINAANSSATVSSVGYRLKVYADVTVPPFEVKKFRMRRVGTNLVCLSTNILRVQGTGQYQYVDTGEIAPPGAFETNSGCVKMVNATEWVSYEWPPICELSCTACDDSPGGIDPKNASVHITFNLGKDSFGNASGKLLVARGTPSPILTTPAGLEYFGNLTNLHVIRTNDWMRQVKTSQVLADILTNNATSYTIRFYHSATYNSGTGLYDPSGSAFSTATIEQGSSTNHLRLITDTGLVVTNEYVWSDAEQGWTLTSGNGLRKETKTWNAAMLISTNLIRNAADQLVYQEVSYYQYLTNWGNVLTQRVVGAGSHAQISRSFYYDNAAVDGTNYGKLRLEIAPSGSWRRYEYDTNGNISKEISQFLNAPTNAADSLCRVMEYDYTTVLTNFSSTRRVEKLLGQEISRQYTLDNGSNQTKVIQCATPGITDLSAVDNLVTITTYSLDTNLVKTVQSVLNPDGTMQIFQTLVSTQQQQHSIVLSGEPNGNGADIIDGTKNITITGSAGQTLSSRAIDILSTKTISLETNTAFDSAGRVLRAEYLDGTFTSASFACCGLEKMTNRDGAITQYIRDALKREVASIDVQNWITTSNALDPMGRELAIIRIGSDASQIVQRQMEYNTAGETVQTINALGGVTTYSNYFDADGQTVQVTTHPDGGTSVETFYQDGTRQKVTGAAVFPARYTNGVELVDGVYRSYSQEIKLDATGQDTSEWTKTYEDMLGRTLKIVYSAASAPYPSTRFYYNQKGQLTNTVDPDGVSSTLSQYNSKGQPEYTAVDLNGNGVIDFDGTDRITRTLSDVTTANGADVLRTRTYVWTEDSSAVSNVVALLEAAATGLSTWQTAYADSSLSVLAKTRTVYASGGNRYVTNTAPDGSYTVNAYVYGRLISVTHKDALNNQLSALNYSYDPHGRVNAVADARNGTTTYYFNNADAVSGIVTPAPSAGQGPQVTSNYFDLAGRIWKTALPDNTSVTNQFYPTGLRKLISGSRQYPVGYSYDAQGRMKTMTNWSSFAAGAGARVTTWNYDSYRGFLTGKVYDGGAPGPTYTYTPAGRLQSRAWARGIITTYGYNAAGELATTVYSDGVTLNVTNVYNRQGRLAQQSGGGSTLAFSYNLQGQLLSESYSGGPLSGVLLSNRYDQHLRRTNVSAVLGSSLLVSNSYAYDQASRLQTVRSSNNVATYTYLTNSSLIGQLQFTAGGVQRLTTTKQYDFLNRLTSISHATNTSTQPSLSFAYAYNVANQRTSVTNADNSRWVYTYDKLGQVTSGKRYWADGTPVAGQQFEYAFDDIGNRTETKAGGDSAGSSLRTASYSANTLNQYTNREVPGFLSMLGTAHSNATVTLWTTGAYSAGLFGYARTERKGAYYHGELALSNTASSLWLTVTNLAILQNGTNADTVATNIGNVFLPQTPETFSYDLDGNLTNDGRWSYSWDAENRLTAVESRASVPLASRRKVLWTFDAKGRRVRQTTSDGSSGSWVPTEDLLFISDGWQHVAELNATNNALVRSYVGGLDLSGTLEGAGGVGGLLMLNDAGAKPNFYANDGNGNVTGLVAGTNGSFSAIYEYDPFGRTIRDTGSMAIENRFQFSTKRRNSVADFLLFEHRILRTSDGNWASRDPIGGKNLYGFVGNDPLCKIDVRGLSALGTVHQSLDRAQMYTRPSEMAATTKFPDLLLRFRGLVPRINAVYGRPARGKEALWYPSSDTLMIKNESVFADTIVHEMAHAFQDLVKQYPFDDASEQMDEAEAYAVESFYLIAQKLKAHEDRIYRHMCDEDTIRFVWQDVWKNYGNLPGDWKRVNWSGGELEPLSKADLARVSRVFGMRLSCSALAQVVNGILAEDACCVRVSCEKNAGDDTTIPAGVHIDPFFQ